MHFGIIMVLYRLAKDSLDASMQISSCQSDEDLGGTHILDLPLALLSRILSQVLDPIAAAYIICSCRTFRALSRSIPFCFKVSCARLEHKVEIDEGVQKKLSLTAIRTWTRRLLSSVRSQMPMTKVLDLSGCWILDEDIAAVLADLRCLKCLILDGCQKLTSAVADALAVSVRLGPHALSLQRCFGLCPAAAGNLLAAAAADGSQLQCVLLSHLDRLDLPRYAPLSEMPYMATMEATRSPDTPNEGPNSHPLFRKDLYEVSSRNAGITVLALHNCGNLGAHELFSVGMTCPHLEYLLIGGSVEALHLRSDVCPSEAVTPAVSALVDSIKNLRRLRVLEATFFPEFVLQGLREQVREGVEVWNFCERESVCSALTFLSNQYIEEQAFYEMNKFTSFQAPKAKWNLNCFDAKSKYVPLALRAAVNCSDLRRRTPLHVAANEAETEMVQGLLTMGASLRLKDSTGATALFDAAWNGHVDICQSLLLGGADAFTRNRSGENSLYVAALKGHTPVVRLFVSYCEATNINWQNSEVYGDGWTPLMAAAVADRQDVAKVLVEAAGLHLSFRCSIKECMLCKKSNRSVGVEASMEEKESVKQKDETAHAGKKFNQILDAQNRYGQTALHIAARRGSLWFVVYLLHVGASLNIQDEYKKRPLDLAQKQKHIVVTNFLKQWESQFRQPKLDNGLEKFSGRENLETTRPYESSPPIKGSGGRSGLKATTSLRQVWRAKETNNKVL